MRIDSIDKLLENRSKMIEGLSYELADKVTRWAWEGAPLDLTSEEREELEKHSLWKSYFN